MTTSMAGTYAILAISNLGLVLGAFFFWPFLDQSDVDDALKPIVLSMFLIEVFWMGVFATRFVQFYETARGFTE